MPPVASMSLVDAENTLKEKGFTIAEETKTISSEEIPEGYVVKTDPQAGSTRKEGAEIVIYVSAGENSYVLEDLKGKDATVEGTLLEEVHGLYVLKKSIEDKENKYKAGEIIKTEPEAGTKMKAGDTVILYIPDQTSAYPDFRAGGWSLAEIKSWCEKYGVELIEIYNPTDEYTPGTIYDQSAVPGTNVMNGQKLTIYIAEEIAQQVVDPDVDTPSE